MATFRLPANIGGEVEAEEVWGGCAGGRPEYHLADGFTLLAPEGQPLERVPPPLPPEPPTGSVGRCDQGYIHIRQGPSWTNHDDRYTTWAEVYAHGLTLLVPDPYAGEPAQLPWRAEIGDDREVLVVVRGDRVTVTINEHGESCTSPVPARAMARALWTAANQAEQSSP